MKKKTNNESANITADYQNSNSTIKDCNPPTNMILNSARRTSEGFCPDPLLGCVECWDQQVELPAGETQQLNISTSTLSAVVAEFPPQGKFV